MYVADGAKTTKNNYSGGGLIRSFGGWKEFTKMRKNHEARIGDERLLGESEFVLQVLKEDNLNLKEEISLKNKGWSLDRLINDVCLYFDIDSNQITARGRNNSVSHAKAVICYWGDLQLGLSSTDLGIRLRLSQSGVSRAGNIAKRMILTWKFINALNHQCPHFPSPFSLNIFPRAGVTR